MIDTSFAGATVLVIDDKEYNRVLLTDVLGARGFCVEAVPDGAASVGLASRIVEDTRHLHSSRRVGKVARPCAASSAPEGWLPGSAPRRSAREPLQSA